jgi:uncharacterized RDD family membrane protein YckC
VPSPGSPPPGRGSEPSGPPIGPHAVHSASVAPPVAGRTTWSAPAPATRARERKYLGYRAGTAYLRRRFGALFIDNLVCLPMMVPCTLVMGGMGPDAMFLYAAAYTLYFFLLEWHTGQTVGKRAAGLRVVRVDGRPIDAMGIGARNALRVVDGIPGPPLVGALSMALTGPRRRRIGDLGGRTMVAEADQHAFARGPWSPLVVVYPVLWLGLALGAGFLAGAGQDPYLAEVDAVCHAKVEAEARVGSFEQAVALSHREAQLIEALPYPREHAATRREILALNQRALAMSDGVLRDMRASRDPQRTYAAARPQGLALAAQLEARFVAIGLHYCGR